MLSTKSIVILVLTIVVAVALVPTVWDATWVDVGGYCKTYNTSNYTKLVNIFGSVKDCRGTAITDAAETFCQNCVNGTSWTILKLTPMLFVALLIIVGILLAVGYRVPGT